MGQLPHVPAPCRPSRRGLHRPAPRLLPATDEFVELVTGTIDDAGINYLSVTGRTKTVGSFAAKARGVLAADSTRRPAAAR